MLICIISMKTHNSIILYFQGQRWHLKDICLMKLSISSISKNYFTSKKHEECFGGSCEWSKISHVLSHLLWISQRVKNNHNPSCTFPLELMGPLILKIIALGLTEIRNTVIWVSSSILTFHSECHSVHKSASVRSCLTWKCEVMQLFEKG